MMRTFLVILSCVVLLSSLSEASSSAAFYFIGSGARAQALGNSFVAVADDPSAIYWNPAGLTQLESPAISLMDRVTTLDTDYANLAGVFPVPTIGTFGLSAIFYRVGQIPVYDEAGNAGGDIADQEGALILSYAYRLRDVSLGINLKGIYQTLDPVNSMGIGRTQTWGMGLDVAVLYHATDRLQVGVMLQDEIKMRDWDDEATYTTLVPRSITSGVSYRQPIGDAHSWSFMADIEQRHELPLSLHVGTEVTLYRVFALRAGLNDITVERRGADIAWADLFRSNLKPTVGFGLVRSFSGLLMHLDYAASFERIGVRNFVSLGAEF